MTLTELKELITLKQVPSEFLIIVDKDNKFLAKQYIAEIAKNAPAVSKVKSIYEPFQSSLNLLTAIKDTLNICYTETFSERAEDYNQFENTIVVCEQIDKTVQKNVENFVIVLPKFENWQIYDYVKVLCPELSEDDVNWLITASKGSIERVLNEVDKICLFEPENRQTIMANIRFDRQTDLYNFELFPVVDALVDGDLRLLYSLLSYADAYKDFEPVVLVNRALAKLRNIIVISQNPNLGYEACGVSFNYYRHISNNYRNLNINAAKSKLKFLMSLDVNLKSSKLELSQRSFLNYLIANMAYRIK